MKKTTTKQPTAKEEIVIPGFKGFNKDFQCNGKQYKENETATFDGEPVICSKGLHFCEYPLDVLAYYPAGTSRFSTVEGSGKTDKKTGETEDTKVCCTTLKIGAEITLHKLIEAGIKFVFERTKKTITKNNTVKKKQCGNEENSGAASNSGDRGAASNSGYRGAASNSGYSGAASNSGYRGAAFTIGSYSAAETNAKDSVAVGVGYQNKVKGNLGSWIVIAERNNNFEIFDIQTAKVDGKKVKADTFYSLKDGKIIEA